METGLLMRTTMWHCCLSIKWVDQGVVYLFYYGIFSYSACLWNQGVLIIEVPLYLKVQSLYNS